MYRVFACYGNQRFRLVRITRSAAAALGYLRDGQYLVCDPSGGCYDEAELAGLAAEAIFSETVASFVSGEKPVTAGQWGARNHGAACQAI